MGRDFLPRADSAFRDWSGSLVRNLARMDPASLDLTPADVAAYAAANDRFVGALRLSDAPGTRTGPVLVAKDQARADLAVLARRLAAKIRTSSASPATRAALGLGVDEPRVRRVARPRGRPTVMVELLQLDAKGVRVLLQDQEMPFRRARPAGVAGAVVLYHAGPNPSPDILDWKLAGTTTRMSFRVDVSREAPGTPLWIVARWLNPMLEPGPASDPARATVAFNAHLDPPPFAAVAAAA